ncbi:hypothetical protein M3Y98_00794800 [Aphelenchoides besseyi]|nr:hypothetical protein M3Y98_00794800 [Aphelenchoides besseyi]KAI6211967.1 hypothetical protein M3Y96_00490500 [Aphelenchoides besseyi]
MPVRPNSLSGLQKEERKLLDEQASRLFEICDTDGKGFVVRADLPKLDGLIPNVSFADLNEFFNANDVTRTSMVAREDFLRGIKLLLIGSNRSNLQRRHLRDLAPHHFRTVSLDTDAEDKPCTKAADLRSKFSIHLSTPVDQCSSSSRGLAKVNSVLTPSASTGSLIGPPVHVYIRDSPTIMDDPEHRNHSEFTHILQRATYSHSDISRLGLSPSTPIAHKPSLWQPTLAEVSRNCGGYVQTKTVPQLRLLLNAAHEELRGTDRIYKVVFVGDSAVGKTCFLHRFCHSRFKPLFNATIGVDFTMKQIRVHDRTITVQLWDTAGQERFRSITKQYFRKADAVVLVYDVTSEQSFLNVRNWIESIRYGVDDSCVMCLVANKIDLCPNDQARVVSYKNGKDLADEFDMIYFETSAFNGLGINDCMRAVAVRLLQRDAENMEEALKLQLFSKSKNRSWCCV